MDCIEKGLILKVSDYKESDKLLTILTVDKGKILVNAKGVKKAKSKLKPYAQSFCFADFELADSHGSFILTGVNLVDSFFELTTDFDKFAYASCVLEILDKICVENQNYAPLLIDSLKCLKTLNYSKIDPRLVLAKFMLNILSFEGFDLNISKCTRCKSAFVGDIYLDYLTGEMLCPVCKTNNAFLVEKPVFSTIKILSTNNYGDLSTIKISKNILDKTIDLLKKNLSFKFEIKLNSLSF